MTITTSNKEKTTALIGPTFIPMELSSKNLIRPAPLIGMGELFDLLFFLLLFCDIFLFKMWFNRYIIYNKSKLFKITKILV